MPVDASAFHPIIQSMLATEESKRAALDREQRKNENLALQADKDKQRKHDDDMLKKEHERLDAQNEIAKATLKLNQQKTNQTAVTNLNRLAATGADLSSLIETDENGEDVMDFLGTKIPVKLLADWKKQSNVKAESLGANAAAVAGAQEPFKQAADQRKNDLAILRQKADSESDAKLESLRQAGRLDVVDKEIKSRERIAQLRDATDRASIQQRKDASLLLGGEGVADEIDGYINNIALTGTGKISDVPQKQRGMVMGEMKRRGYTSIDKKDIDSVKTISSLNEMLDDAKELAKVGSINSNPLSSGGRLLGFGNAAELEKSVRAKYGQIAKIISTEGGAKTEGDINRAGGWVFSPTLTTEQNLRNIEKASKTLKGMGHFVTDKYSLEQLGHIAANHGIDPETLDFQEQPKATGATGKGTGTTKTKKVLKFDPATGDFK